MPVPPIVPQIAASVLLAAMNRRPSTPNLVQPVMGQIRDQRRGLERTLDRRSDAVAMDLAASGAYGSEASGARDDLYLAGDEATARFDALAADMITEALREQQLVEYQQAQSAFANRVAGQQQALSGFGQYLALRDLLRPEGDGGEVVPPFDPAMIPPLPL